MKKKKKIEKKQTATTGYYCDALIPVYVIGGGSWIVDLEGFRALLQSID